MANTTRVSGGPTDIKNQFDDLKNKGQEKLNEAGQAATGLMDKARQTISAAGDRVDSATSAVGEGMTSLAESIRHTMPREGVLGTTSDKVAGTLETSGHYLQEEGIVGVVDDLANLIRRNPLPALFIGVGIGFILARTLRS